MLRNVAGAAGVSAEKKARKSEKQDEDENEEDNDEYQEGKLRFAGAIPHVSQHRPVKESSATLLP